jgi:hypothetical protein
VRFEVGDRSRIRFWYDMWVGDMTLKEDFPVLFSIACFNEALVVEHVQFLNDTYYWNNFIKFVHDWEMELVTSFFNLLYSIVLRQGGEGRICWSHSNGGYSRFDLFIMRFSDFFIFSLATST